MTTITLPRLLRPPTRLRLISDKWQTWVRILWMLLFLAAAAADVAGLAYTFREAKDYRHAFHQLGLDYQVQYEGDVLVSVPRAGADTAEPDRHIVAIDGRRIDPETRIAALAEHIARAPGPTVRFALSDRSGKVVDVLRQRSGPTDAARDTEDARTARIAIQKSFAILACLSLLACSLTLAIRRPRDPVAMLFAISFSAMAMTIDPPLPMWMALGLSWIDDVVAACWFYFLLIAISTFPDGVFVPKFYRWLLVGGVPIAILLSIPNINEDLQAVLGVLALLGALVGVVRRYRRLAVGIERQQIKYAAFGMALGLLLVLAAMVMVIGAVDANGDYSANASLTILCLFSAGMATIPLGLLVALLRFRLWEADTIISRSAAYAVVTVIVGIVWAATADLAKLVVASVMGQQHSAGATTIGAIIAAGIFAPTQSLVVGWTKRRFGGPGQRLLRLPDQIEHWQESNSASELAMRTLSVVDQAIHPSFAVISVDKVGHDVTLASINVDDRDIDPLAIDRRLVIGDGSGQIGHLLLGRRSDGNRYNRTELESLGKALPALATALRATRGRSTREEKMQHLIDEMHARIVQLESGTGAKPA